MHCQHPSAVKASWSDADSCTAHTHTHTFSSPFSGTTRVSRYQKGKTNLDFTEARDSGISWAICKSASCSRQTTTPSLHHSVFYRPDALPAAQPIASEAKATKSKSNQKHWRQLHGLQKSANHLYGNFQGNTVFAITPSFSSSVWKQRTYVG